MIGILITDSISLTAAVHRRMIQENHGLLVIISQGQSRSPEKRSLEEGIAQFAATLPNTIALLVPHLYDLSGDGETIHRLRQWKGPIVIHSWLFERATHWILDRADVRGKVGEVELINPDATLDDEESELDVPDDKEEDRVANLQARPDRTIYSIDLRASDQPAAFERELQRIHQVENLSDGTPREFLTLDRFLLPTNSTALAADGSSRLDRPASHDSPLGIQPLRLDEHPTRRWYPVIDYSRCTNCMECIDFCLFGVYGVDRAETILVEQPDNCRKGCPACSRVCPENAIIFPQHKSPAIAGAPVEAGTSFKIDLSKLFGAPDRNEDAAAAAARERDEQLILAGRAAVGAGEKSDASTSTVAPLSTAPHAGTKLMAGPAESASKDKLDSLIDELDSLDL